MSERIIIGESERAGHPISAPVEKSGDGFPSTMIRWRHTGTSFVLEQWKKNVHPSGKPFGIWVEVPCVMPEQGKGE